jgi:molybdate transport system permease protein
MIGADDLAAILLSLRVSAVATLVSLPLAILAAWLLARRGLPGRTFLDGLIHLPLVLPPVAVGYGLLVLMGRQGLIGAPLAQAGIVFAFRWTGAALGAGVMAFPLMVRPIRLSIEAIDPEVDDAARTLGASALSRFLRITLPLAAPGILAGAVLGFARALGEFGATIAFVAAIPGETLTLPSDIWLATQSPGDETRTLLLCGVSLAIGFAAILAGEAMNRRAAVDRRSR